METKEYLEKFTEQHGLTLVAKGECGFGRPCVGFTKPKRNGIDSYVDYNPIDSTTFEDIWERDERLYAPDGVNSYHKVECLAVLVDNDDYDAGLDQLATWMRAIEAHGPPQIVEYRTGASGIQAMVTGSHGWALRIGELR